MAVEMRRAVLPTGRRPSYERLALGLKFLGRSLDLQDSRQCQQSAEPFQVESPLVDQVADGAHPPQVIGRVKATVPLAGGSDEAPFLVQVKRARMDTQKVSSGTDDIHRTVVIHVLHPLVILTSSVADALTQPTAGAQRWAILYNRKAELSRNLIIVTIKFNGNCSATVIPSDRKERSD